VQAVPEVYSMSKSRLLLVGLAVACIATAACVKSTPRSTAVPPPTTQATAVPTPPGQQAAPSPTPQSVPVSTTQRFGLFLEIEGLGDENIVRGDSVVARGQTTPDAILSINGVIVSVSSDGTFEVQLALEPGPNVLEVVASDLDGNEVSKVIAVVSLPEGVQS
jgi:Glucodextranase, domain B